MVDGLVRTFEKLYADRGSFFDVDWSLGSFRGEAQDLTDLIGNLLDNAGKWARERVAIRAGRATAPTMGPPPFLSPKSTTTARALTERARRGDRARTAARRVAAGFRPRPVDRRRPRLDLWRLARPRR